MYNMRGNCCVLLLSIICFLWICERTSSANILYISSTASPSHSMWDKTLAMALRDKGHHITFVTHFFEKNTDNFTYIILEGVQEVLLSHLELENTVNSTATEDIQLLFKWIENVCLLNIKTQGFKKLLTLAEIEVKYDLIMSDISAGICFYPIVELFGYPLLIGTSPFGLPPYIAENFGVDFHSSYLPHYTTSFSHNMNIMQRFYSYFLNMYEIILKYYCWEKIKLKLDEFYGRDVKYIYEVEKNFSILLPNYDPILDYPRSLPPDVIPVGGLHVNRVTTLSQDWQEYLDNSKDGVILFTLGTNVRSDKLKMDKRKVILDTFSQLKQNIIWKFESDISDLPKNVLVSKFFPQNDILGHPNVKLLITHGGALSTQEAMYHGVPVITIPFFLDQRAISNKIVNRKIGLSLNYETLTVHNMLSTIREVINNPTYVQNMKKLSQTYRSYPEDPIDRAVIWIQYVLQQNGAAHLKIPTRRMSYFHLHLLDIWIFLYVVLIISFIILRKICYKILGTYLTVVRIKTKIN